MNFKTVAPKAGCLPGYYLGKYIAPSDCVAFDVYLKADSLLTLSSSNAVMRTLKAVLGCGVESVKEAKYEVL